MKVIITESFSKHYKKFFWKEYLSCSIEKIVSIINKEIIIHWMYINRPFMKIKFNFCNRAIRMVVSKDEDALTVIPIFITDKNNKKYWYNLTWSVANKRVLQNMAEITDDINNQRYEVF